jgi:hypothetical protein
MTYPGQPHRKRFAPAWIGTALCLALLLCAAAAMNGCRRGETDANTGGGSPGDEIIPTIQAVEAADLPRYAGSESCAPCHPVAARQSGTHHAHTAGRITPAHVPLFQQQPEVRDKSRQVRYRIRAANGGYELVAAHGTKAGSVRAEWVFGSGNRAYTYMGQYLDNLVELRLTYYTRVRRWDYTPGQQPGYPVSTPLGRNVDIEDARHCFTCHATALVEENGRARPEQSLLGVGCEACHGPGRDHIEAVKRGDRNLHMPRLTSVRDRISIELCGQCHRSPLTSDAQNPAIGTQLPRMQGLAMTKSACFRKSGGRLSCITCHDPHRDADRTSHAEYNAQCRACHTPNHPPQVSCRFKPEGDCVACHMPTQPVDLPSTPRFRTHWIKIWGKTEQ